MRNLTKIAILTAGLAFLLAGCDEQDKSIAVTGVSLSETSVSLLVGEEKTVTATVKPSDATNKELTWSSSSEAVATVVDGVVKGVSEGVATIKVTTADGGFSAECLVNVSYIHASGVSLDINEDQVLVIGDELVVTATVTPADAVDVSVEWASSDPQTVSVTAGEVKGEVAKATVRAIKGGSATITVTTKDQGHSATLKVTVPGTSTDPNGSFEDDNYGKYE